jgi:hypothetical protein
VCYHYIEETMNVVSASTVCCMMYRKRVNTLCKQNIVSGVKSGRVYSNRQVLQD